MPRNSDVYLRDIALACRKIQEFTRGLNYDAFRSDERTLLAVTRLLEMLGEAVGRLPDELTARQPHIPWRSIKDFRNHLAHHYWDLDTEIVWDIIRRELDPLEKAVQSLLSE